jgi:hypothetical protein
MEVVIEGYGLRMVVVNKESLRLLDGFWDARGVYLLLGRAEDPAKYTAYVGEATKQGLRQRVSQHVRTEKNWDRALLVTSTDHGFDSSAIGWLEGRFYDVLANAAAAEVMNRLQPSDETLPEYRREGLGRYVEPVMLAMRALGCPPDTADQRPAAAPPAARSTRRVFKESVADLIEAGLLKAGTRLRPMAHKYDATVTVLDDGSLQLGDEVYNAVSPAAVRVTGGQSEPGWNFWGAPSGDGSLVSLFELRARLQASAAGSSRSDLPEGGASTTTGSNPGMGQTAAGGSSTPPRGPGIKQYKTKVPDLMVAGVLHDGETAIALRKRVGPVEGTLHADGTLTVKGVRYSSLSAAAKAVSGTTSEPGPEYWGVRRPEGIVSVFELRRRFEAGGT